MSLTQTNSEISRIRPSAPESKNLEFELCLIDNLTNVRFKLDKLKFCNPYNPCNPMLQTLDILNYKLC